MNTFEQICKMTQSEVKKYMEDYLSANNYDVDIADGYLYAEPKYDRVPVLLVAHMDTVHREVCSEIINKNGKLSSPQGIGGDDRCGVYMIMNVVKELHCPVLLTEDEEVGCVGAHMFAKSEYIEDLGVNYMIEFDRKGNNDAVFYSCDNKNFKAFVEENSPLKEAQGSYSDISVLMSAAKLAGVNLSCGYYNAHTKDEYVVFDEMLAIIEIAKKLIKVKIDEPFEYVAKTYASSFGGYGRDYHQYSLWDRDYSLKHKNIPVDSLDLELEADWEDVNGEEQVDICTGRTKAECWFDFFMNNPDVCWKMITDFSFS